MRQSYGMSNAQMLPSSRRSLSAFSSTHSNLTWRSSLIVNGEAPLACGLLPEYEGGRGLLSRSMSGDMDAAPPVASSSLLSGGSSTSLSSSSMLADDDEEEALSRELRVVVCDG